MNSLTLLDTTATETMVRFLSDRFGVSVPQLAFVKRRSNRGSYSPTYKRLKLARPTELWVVVHEFSHHLNRQLNGLNGEPHSRSFFHNLLRTIEATGLEDYPWPKEYRQIQRWKGVHDAK